jgi:hypothetical protein
MQVYDTGECCTGRLYYSVMILRMYAIDSIAIIYTLDDDDNTELKRWAMVFATVPDEHETNYVSPVSTRFQPDIQSLASSALLSNQSLMAVCPRAPDTMTSYSKISYVTDNQYHSNYHVVCME